VPDRMWCIATSKAPMRTARVQPGTRPILARSAAMGSVPALELEDARASPLPPMPIHLLDAMAREGFEEVIALNDRRSGLRAFLAIHDTCRGPAFGGIRRWTYRDERDALIDCLRLSRAMTHKCALMDLRAGGAKMVLLDADWIDRAGAYRYVGEVVDRLGGRFYTGPDVGTGPDELACVAEKTRFVTNPGPAGPGELGASTADGVFRGIEAALMQLDGEVDWAARRFVVQGLGEVGGRLAARLSGLGAKVLATDVDEERADLYAKDYDIEMLEPATELDVPCDVFVPCALGGILHDLSIERLRCRAVAGGANNVLAKPLHGDLLHDRGIMYVPDFVLNSGALIRGTIFHLEGRREPVDAIGQRIGSVVARVLDHAASEDRPPARVAIQEAEDTIQAWRKNTVPPGPNA
jgi:leucine dehydrogenase